MKHKKEYTAPELTVVSFASEQGYAGSTKLTATLISAVDGYTVSGSAVDSYDVIDGDGSSFWTY